MVATRTAWQWLRQVPRTGPDVMSHTDLVPGNVLIDQHGDGDRLTGVLDGGGFSPADPALDPVGGWHMLDTARRDRLHRGLGSSDAKRLRGAAWALAQSLGLVWCHLDTNPPLAALGRRAIERVLADADLGLHVCDNDASV